MADSEEKKTEMKVKRKRRVERRKIIASTHRTEQNSDLLIKHTLCKIILLVKHDSFIKKVS